MINQSIPSPIKFSKSRPPNLIPLHRRRRRRAASRSRGISSDRRDVRLIDTVRIARAIHHGRVVIIYIKKTARTAKLLAVTGA